MSGQQDLSAEGVMAGKERELDGFEAGLGLIAGCPAPTESEANRIIGLPPEALNNLSADKCGENAIVLTQYAHFLKKAENKERSKVTHAESALRWVITPVLDQVTGYGLEEKRMKAIRVNEAAASYETIRARSQARLDRIEFISQTVKELAHTYMALANTKRGGK